MLHECFDPRIALHELTKARLHFHRLGERIIEPLLGRWNQFRDRIGFGKRQAQSPPDILDRRFGFERSEGRDLCDSIRSIFVFNVLNDLRPTTNTEIHVDVGHRPPLRIKKPLKQQNMSDRIEIGNFKRVSHQAAG